MSKYDPWMTARFRMAALGGVLLLSVIAAGCGGSAGAKAATANPPVTAPAAAPPTVTVTATPPSAQPGQSVTVAWQTQNATAVTLNGTAVSASGTQSVVVSQNTTFTVVATGAGGTQQAAATVTIVPPTITSFTATPATVVAGKPSTLAWQTSNADKILLDGTAVNATGTLIVTPAQTTTYTLAASGPGGAAESKTTVTVTPAPPAPTVTFTATPDAIQAGQSSVLAWQTTNATTVTLDGTPVPASGTQTVSPPKTAFYDLVATGDGGTQKVTAGITVTPAPGSGLKHVAVIVMENKDYGAIIGSSSAPFFNSLANQYALATNYFANSIGSSLPDYFMLTVGDTITNTAAFTGTVTTDNVVRELTKAGKTWKVYAEDLPSVGFISMADSGLYVYIHNPFVFLCDVIGGCPTFSAAQANNVVPYSHLASDLAAGNLPNYIFIVPNNCNNMHDCSTGTGDAWLKANVPPLLNSPEFQSNGILVITFDEGVDGTNGGGHVATIIAGSTVKAGYRSTTFYQHQSVLRMMMRALGVFSYPNAAATAPDMDEFFSVPLP